MFPSKTYIDRRKQLKSQVKTGIILFPGNSESPINFAASCYPFRQDSSFLYYWGLDLPELVAVIDIENDTEIIFGNDFSLDDIIWMGPQTSLRELAAKRGVLEVQASEKLKTFIEKASHNNKREIHYLPQYRIDNQLKIEQVTGILSKSVNDHCSPNLVQAVIAQRLIKSELEISQIDAAMDITAKMFALAMETSKPGKYEYEVVGKVEGLVLSQNRQLPFPFIFTVRGEKLHGHSRHLKMQSGDLVVMDAGAESLLHYNSDITRTFPVSGKFTPMQKDIYQIVLNANEAAIAMMQPGKLFRDVHLHAAMIITNGLKDLGLMKGNTTDAVSEGAHGLFFPHGLGHPLGLDVHDMENFGENLVGYSDQVQRSQQFGLSNLRFGKELQENMVHTIEPGIYFIPELIKQWQSQNKFKPFINYDKVTALIGFGGIRIEDDVFLLKSGCRNLSACIPKSITEIESACGF
jgi:Xaa-Pro dipeptidase